MVEPLLDVVRLLIGSRTINRSLLVWAQAGKPLL
jgi:hypothetical protein